ncbi:MAG: outer membrane lipoprotein carrier protein LolA [Bdellovibrionaceae bacterium]|nr:outer membrane lipoprotein carrier protein LolA [Pseudobdellovibrionaceae bacterium]
MPFYALFFFFGLPVKATLDFDQVVSRYKQANIVRTTVTRVTKSELLGSETKQEGKLVLSKNGFSFLIEKPKKGFVIFDGKYLWTSEDTEAEKPIITRTKADFTSDDSLFLLKLFWGREVKERPKIIQQSERGEDIIVKLEFENSKQFGPAEVRLNRTKKIVREVRYPDEIGNQVSYVFGPTLFFSKKMSEEFRVPKIKNARVTEI